MYPDYIKNGIEEPKSVTKYTKDYQKSSDSIMEYIEENIEITQNKKDTIQLSIIMNNYRNWYREMYSEKCPSRKIVKPYLEKFFKEPMKSYGWKGAKLKDNENDNEDNDSEL